jgi:hypothetical protein
MSVPAAVPGDGPHRSRCGRVAARKKTKRTSSHEMTDDLAQSQILELSSLAFANPFFAFVANNLWDANMIEDLSLAQPRFEQQSSFSICVHISAQTEFRLGWRPR